MESNWFEIGIGIVIAIVIALLVFGVINSPNCKRGHYEVVHHAAWTQMITTSMKPLIMIPIYHPAYDANEFICDEYCGKNDLAEECK